MVIANAMNASLPLIQLAYTSLSSWSDNTSKIYTDDTIPQITEGDSIISLAFTPKRSDSLIRVEATVPLYASGGGTEYTCALFRSDSTDALSAFAFCYAEGFATSNIPSAKMMQELSHTFDNDTTSTYTFSIRMGNGSGTTKHIYINGDSSGQRLGGSQLAYLSIKEFLQ